MRRKEVRSARSARYLVSQRATNGIKKPQRRGRKSPMSFRWNGTTANATRPTREPRETERLKIVLETHLSFIAATTSTKEIAHGQKESIWCITRASRPPLKRTNRMKNLQRRSHRSSKSGQSNGTTANATRPRRDP